VGPRSRYLGIGASRQLRAGGVQSGPRQAGCTAISHDASAYRYVLRRLMIDRTTVSAIAVELGVSWHTVNTIAMGATAALVAAAGPDRSSR
jgi:hypothetical protein